MKDLGRVVDHLPVGLIGMRDRALLLVGYAGGFRRSEPASLTIEDAHFTEDGWLSTCGTRRRIKRRQGGGSLSIKAPILTPVRFARFRSGYLRPACRQVLCFVVFHDMAKSFKIPGIRTRSVSSLSEPRSARDTTLLPVRSQLARRLGYSGCNEWSYGARHHEGDGSECTGTSVTLWTGHIRYKSLADLRVRN
ncbi:MAG: integrase family protein [Edaphobacter sp.]|nr:integrase family protein [Edaphobacter sp.]